MRIKASSAHRGEPVPARRQLIGEILGQFSELAGVSTQRPWQLSRTAIRNDAERLLAVGDETSADGLLALAIGHAARTFHPRQDYVLRELALADPVGETSRHLGETWDALSLCRRLNDPLASAIVALIVARAELEAAQLGSKEFERVTSVCGILDDHIATLRNGATSATLGVLRDTTQHKPSAKKIAWRLQVARHRVAAAASRMLGDLDAADRERRWQLRAAHQTGDERLVVDALGKAAHIARRRGKMHRSQKLLHRQRRLARNSSDPLVQAIAHRSHAARARAIENWSEDKRRCILYMQLLLQSEGHIVPRENLTPAAARDAADHMWRSGRLDAVDQIGRIAHDIARSLLHLTRPADDHTDIADWVSAARRAWTLTQSSSLVATEFQELRLHARLNTMDPKTIGTRLVECSKNWRRPWGPARAISQAARDGAPGDKATADRIEALLACSPHYADQAPLLISRAQWYLGSAACSEHRSAVTRAWSPVSRSDEPELAHQHATTALESARGALAALDRAGTGNQLFVRQRFEARKVMAESMRFLHDRFDDEGCDRRAQLAVRRKSLRDVALQLVMAGDGGVQRATVELRTLGWLTDTARLAAELNDHSTFDCVCEVARRDIVGSVLSFSTKGKLRFRAALDHLNSSLDSDLSNRSDRAMRRVEGLIGPIAQAVSGDGEPSGYDCESVAENTVADIVLSLWTPPGYPLFRHVCVRNADTFRHELAVITNFDATDFTGPLHEVELRQQLETAAEVLLPDSARTVLDTATPENPARMLVIPTHLSAVPFAGLTLNGGFVIDVCEVTTMQSLTAAALIARREDVEVDTDCVVSVYDESLLGVLPEKAALQAGHRTARSVKRVHKLLRKHPVGLLAMGLHGYVDSEDSWLSTRLMPNGEFLSIGHVLRWQVPGLVVLSSCYTHVGSGRNGGAAGFPVAFQLGGAHSVLGTVATVVPDASTGEIIARFFDLLRNGQPPAAALRGAQLAWIDADRRNRKWATTKWARLVLYGVPRK